MPIDRTPEEKRAADIETARQFLAKAERASTDEERDTFDAAAERLIVRLGVDRALIESRLDEGAKREEITTRRLGFTTGDPLMEIRFVARIVEALGLEAVFWNLGDGDKAIEVFGHESDLTNALTLVTSLRQQADKGRARWEADSDEFYYARLDKDRPAMRRLRRGYMLAFARGAADRIRGGRARVVQEAEAGLPGTALVVADRQALVKAAKTAKYAKLRKTRGIQVDRRSSHAGYRDGQKARTGENEVEAAARAALEA